MLAGDGHLHRPPAVGGVAARRRRALQQHGPSAGGQRQRHELHRHAGRHLRRLRHACLRARSGDGQEDRRVSVAGRAGRRASRRCGAISTSLDDYLIGGADPLFNRGPGQQPRRERQLFVQQPAGRHGSRQRQGAVDGRRPRAASGTTPSASAAAGCTASTASPGRSCRASSAAARTRRISRGWSCSTWPPARSCGAPSRTSSAPG